MRNDPNDIVQLHCRPDCRRDVVRHEIGWRVNVTTPLDDRFLLALVKAEPFRTNAEALAIAQRIAEFPEMGFHGQNEVQGEIPPVLPGIVDNRRSFRPGNEPEWKAAQALPLFNPTMPIRPADFTRKQLIRFLSRFPASPHDMKHRRRMDGVRLAGIDLSGLNLAKFQFWKADFRGCKCVGTDFTECVLGHADFSGADLTDAIFEDVDCVDNARFVGANLQGISAGGMDAETADFTDADLTGARLDHAKLPFCIFKRAKLIDVSFRRARFFANDWEDAIIKGGDWREVTRWGGGEPKGQPDLPFDPPDFDYEGETRRAEEAEAQYQRDKRRGEAPHE